MSTANYRVRRPPVHGPEGLSSHAGRPIAWKSTAVVLGGVFLALALAAPAAGSLKTKLDRALRARGVSSSQTGAIVYDLAHRRFVYRHNTLRPLKPASNEKLPVAVTALSVLGTNFKFRTELRAEGHQTGDVWEGRIVLKGYGDPSLSGRELGRLAAAFAKLGVARVTGAVVGDESYFDTVRTAPGWKASYYKDECPPLSALVVNRAHFKGSITSNPALAAAKILRAKLVNRGVEVDGRARVGQATGDADTFVIESSALRWVVRRMDRQSDNFYAEMLMKELGARTGRGGTTHGGVQTVRRELRARGIPMDGVAIADGSGLSAYDRLTPKAVAKLLRSAFADPEIDGVFVASLPLAGVNGTLFDRMTSGPAYRNVRAKTGTTDSASTLSGYVRTRYVFSILMNGSPIPWWNARQAQDRFAQVLAAQ
jgi:D-alanyl-D-alanine carboxypeptidase/D-alanyl-D-alanine-endopeptidase (penicillin-binding protein 4)